MPIQEIHDHLHARRPPESPQTPEAEKSHAHSAALSYHSRRTPTTSICRAYLRLLLAPITTPLASRRADWRGGRRLLRPMLSLVGRHAGVATDSSAKVSAGTLAFSICGAMPPDYEVRGRGRLVRRDLGADRRRSQDGEEGRAMYALNSSLVRVKRKSPCRICGKSNWSSMTDDGVMAICMRVAEGSIKESKNFGYIHILEEREYRPLDPIPRKPEAPTRAPLERRDAVYRAMLATLTLTARHAENLRERGLSTLTIERNAYASLPALSRIPDLCADLAREHNLANVPGFYRDEEGRWMFEWRPGFFVPARDTQGRIQGCQIRQDRGSRYIWFSSPEDEEGKRKAGASSGA